MIESLICKQCPRCQADRRYWHEAGVFLVTQTEEDSSSGGFAQAAAVVCPDCGHIEFYSRSAELLKDLPRAEVPRTDGPPAG